MVKPTISSNELDGECEEEENQRWPQGFLPEQLEVPINWDGEECEGNRLGRLGYQTLNFGHVHHEMYIRWPNGDVEYVVEYMCLEFRNSDINLDILRILMVFKALKGEEINVRREAWRWRAVILQWSVKRPRSWRGTSKGHWEGAICEEEKVTLLP